MKRGAVFALLLAGATWPVAGQSPIKPVRAEERAQQQAKVEKQRNKQAQHSANIEFRGASAFGEKDLRAALKEQITTLDDYGLTAARGDDVAFFLELYYRKHGYSKVNVRYRIEGGDRLVLE